MRRRVATVALFLLSATCVAEDVAPHTSADEGQVAVSDEQGFKTITFSVRRSRLAKAEDDSDVLLLRFGGDWSGQRVGMGFALSLSWEQPAQRPPIPIWFSDATFQRTGAESDALLAKLCEVFGQTSTPSSMQNELTVEVVQLGEKPGPGANRYNLKIFNRGKSQQEYAEMYVRIDLGAGTVAFSEKDPEYRAPLVKAFTASK